MVVSNRTIGPPWNIWVDQGDSLALRDAAWLQFYCESHQDLVDTILVAFRVAEDATDPAPGDRRPGRLRALTHPDGASICRSRSWWTATCRRSSCHTAWTPRIRAPTAA